MEEFTTAEMQDCFEAGVKFARDMFNNPSNAEYIASVMEEKNEVKSGKVKKGT